MKKKIEEVQNYFVNKITACQFDSYEIKESATGWFEFKTESDDIKLNFSVHPLLNLYCPHHGDFKINVPNDRLLNLIDLIQKEQAKLRNEKIEKLQSELAELTNNLEI